MKKRGRLIEREAYQESQMTRVSMIAFYFFSPYFAGSTYNPPFQDKRGESGSLLFFGDFATLRQKFCSAYKVKYRSTFLLLYLSSFGNHSDSKNFKI